MQPAPRRPPSFAPARIGGALLAVVALGLALLAAGSAALATGSGRAAAVAEALPSAVPDEDTPDIQDGVVFAVTQIGSLVVVGGNFTSVADHGSATVQARSDLLAYDAASGTVSQTFAPSLDGQVDALLPGPVAGTVFVAGSFRTVDGTASRGLTLLDTATGAIVGGFTPPVLNGTVDTLAMAQGHLVLGGNFSVAAGTPRAGMASVDPASGALDGYATVAFAGHHNYNGTGAQGSLGPRSIATSPDGTRMMVIGNFTTASGQARNQAVMLDLSASAATVDPNWVTKEFTARCNAAKFDTSPTGVAYSPDGSYFAIASTGGLGGGNDNANTDGSRALCDSTARFEAGARGTHIRATWVDYTGEDSLWSIAVSPTAIYVGGHQRWLNNPRGANYAGGGAVPRPGITALDPVNGMPFAWNPGRNPRGAGAYAVYANDSAVFVGSDTDYIGNFQYKHEKIASFSYAGGYTPASTATATLPSNLYLAGPLASNTNDANVDDLAYRSVDGPAIGDLTPVPTSIAWSATRGAFAVGDRLFWPSTAKTLQQASFDGTTVGTPTTVDPYDDPYWDTASTGVANQTYQGKKPSYYPTIGKITGQFYTAGRVYYTLSQSSTLHWRYFSPDSGTIGSDDHVITTVANVANLGAVAGMVLSGSTLYYANGTDGTLHTESWVKGAPVASTDQTVSGPALDGRDWRARSLFLYGAPHDRAAVSFVGAADGNTVSAAPGVVVPTGATAGDVELLYAAVAAAGTTSDTPDGDGWTLIARRGNGPYEISVYARSDPGGDAGTTLTLPLAASSAVDLQLAVYRGAVAPTAGASSSDSGTATHQAPAVAVGVAGSWVASYWSQRTGATSAWTVPAALSSRQTGVGSGPNHVDATLADTAAGVNAGTYPRQSADAAVAGGRGGGVSVVLEPAAT